MDEDLRKPVVFVVGIDFGTSSSGFAFSKISDTTDSIYRIANYPGASVTTPKTLTEILYDNESKEPVDWGFSARTKFFSPTKDKKKEIGKFSLFSNFKMDLFRKNELQFSDGVKVEPLVIITDYLKFLVDFAVKKVSEEEKIEIEQIRWVLTIPACWTDREKILMKKAAYESGMISKMDEDSERFLFALEPEAAGLYSCITLKKNKKLNEFMNEGENFMIIDAGGGTLDITAHQVLKDGFLKELCIGQGASVGSTDVDKDFFEYVKNLLGVEGYTEFQTDFRKYFEEMRKKWIDVKESEIAEYYSVEVSSKFKHLLKKHKPEQSKDFDDEIELNFKEMYEIFRGTLEDCSHVIEKFFNDLENKKIKVDKILLVGGFGSSKIFQNYIEKNFGERVSNILVPENPSAAVLLGAVHYGKNKKLIKSRVLRRTYGVGVYSYFKPGIHKEEKKVSQFLNSEKFLCKDIFHIWARAGEEIEGEKKISKNYSSHSHGQKVMKFDIYSTSEPDPMYVDEFEDTQMDLSFSIDLEQSFTLNEVQFDIFFGSTEVRIDVSHNGKKFEKKFLLK